MKATKRYAKTKAGKKVQLSELTEVVDGWWTYIMGLNGYAVQIFIPRK